MKVREPREKVNTSPFDEQFSKPYFVSEEHLRRVVMNALINKGVTVWDSRPEKTNEPIIVDGIPMKIAVGDIPFFWKGHYYVIELKLYTLGTKVDSHQNQFRIQRRPIRLSDSQSDLLLKGGGLLMVVTEPHPKFAGRSGIKGVTRAECNKGLNQYRELIGKNRLFYECYLLSQNQFQSYWENHLKTAPIRPSERGPGRILSFLKLKEIVPKSYYRLYMSDFGKGNIANIILKHLETSPKVSTQLTFPNQIPNIQMKHSYFTSEEEVRNFVMKALLYRGVPVWDCRPEKCNNPIVVDGIPMKNLVGDIPFFWNKRYYIIEIKFIKLNCKLKKDRKQFFARKHSISITEHEINMLLQGGGLLLVIMEPSPKVVGMQKAIKARTKLNCENQLKQQIHIPLGKNQLFYECYLLGQENFKNYWESYLKNTSKYEGGWGHIRTLNLTKLKELVPETQFTMYMSEFKNGFIGNTILNFLQR
ncbi:MAG: hypothetical protein HWN65_16565 [Candidatus Helarchaeota archaeon]|nr:hypothetical protein [Candidatus Helarchaeota archaeon]